MAGLSGLGIFHTLISVVAVISGFAALVRNKEILPKTALGKTYVTTTIISCGTGFGIFHHGGFGKAHVLGIITLVVLCLAFLAGAKKFGKLSRYVETISYSATFFFHMIPGVTETATRLPLGTPFVADPDAPVLQKIIGGFFVVFLIGASAQVWRLRSTDETNIQPSR